MISVYCPENRLAVRLAASFVDERFSVEPSWRRFTRKTRAAECAVVVFPMLAGPGFRQLCDWSRQPRPPAILVTSFDTDNLTKLTGLVMDELVCVDNLSRQLPIALSTVREPDPLAAVARYLAEHPSLSPELRIALITGCRGAAPPRTVAEYAAAATCHQSTLYRHFRQVNPTGEGSIGDFVDYVLLMRALERLPGSKLSRVAAELAVDERTLRRTAGRLTGRALSDLRSDGLGKAVGFFQKWLESSLPHTRS